MMEERPLMVSGRKITNRIRDNDRFSICDMVPNTHILKYCMFMRVHDPK